MATTAARLVLRKSWSVVIRPGGLRWNLLRVLGLVMLISSVLLGATVYAFTSRNEQAMWQARQREAASHASQVVSAYLARIRDYMVLGGALSDQQILSNPNALQEYLLQNPNALEIVRLDADGNVVAGADRGNPMLVNLFTLSQANWFSKAKAGLFYVGALQISAQDEPYVITAAPSTGGGVVVARIRMQHLWNLIASLRFGRTGLAYVVTDEGQVIAHPAEDLVLGMTNLAGRPEMAAIAAAPKHLWNGVYTNFLGEYVQGVSLTVPDTNWIVIGELQVTEASSLSRMALLLLLVVATAFGILTLAMIFRALRYLVIDPIESLRVASVRIGQGDFTHRVHFDRQDEVGQVVEAFNDMALGLQRRDAQIAAKTTALGAEITKHKMTQQELAQLNRTLEQRVEQRTAELEKTATNLMRSNAELQEFAYVASHDLQEPLRKVRAFGDRLLANYNQVLDERGQDYIVRMQRGAERMQSLIDALLTYSRVSTKAQPFVLVDLNQIARDVLSDLENQVERVGGQVQIGELTEIEADPMQMRQLMQNLISNGLKFHRPDVPPVVTVSGTWLSDPAVTAPAGLTYQLTIADNGIGFESQYATQIFQVFQRLHGRNEYEGTGVGLAICRKIVERHDGAIVAVGTPGEGASFIITLPACHPVEPVIEE